jgi:hypothetical protein
MTIRIHTVIAKQMHCSCFCSHTHLTAVVALVPEQARGLDRQAREHRLWAHSGVPIVNTYRQTDRIFAHAYQSECRKLPSDRTESEKALLHVIAHKSIRSPGGAHAMVVPEGLPSVRQLPRVARVSVVVPSRSRPHVCADAPALAAAVVARRVARTVQVLALPLSSLTHTHAMAHSN